MFRRISDAEWRSERKEQTDREMLPQQILRADFSWGYDKRNEDRCSFRGYDNPPRTDLKNNGMKSRNDLDAFAVSCLRWHYRLQH